MTFTVDRRSAIHAAALLHADNTIPDARRIYEKAVAAVTGLSLAKSNPDAETMTDPTKEPA